MTGHVVLATRWTARLLAGFLLGLVLLFVVGEGAPNPAGLTTVERLQFVAHIVTLLGLVVLWVWELPGGLLTIGGMLAFYAINYLAIGKFPGGWVFPLFYAPGVLSLSSWTLARVKSTPPES